MYFSKSESNKLYSNTNKKHPTIFKNKMPIGISPLELEEKRPAT